MPDWRHHQSDFVAIRDQYEDFRLDVKTSTRPGETDRFILTGTGLALRSFQAVARLAGRDLLAVSNLSEDIRSEPDDIDRWLRAIVHFGSGLTNIIQGTFVEDEVTGQFLSGCVDCVVDESATLCLELSSKVGKRRSDREPMMDLQRSPRLRVIRSQLKSLSTKWPNLRSAVVWPSDDFQIHRDQGLIHVDARAVPWGTLVGGRNCRLFFLKIGERIVESSLFDRHPRPITTDEITGKAPRPEVLTIEDAIGEFGHIVVELIDAIHFQPRTAKAPCQDDRVHRWLEYLYQVLNPRIDEAVLDGRTWFYRRLPADVFMCSLECLGGIEHTGDDDEPDDLALNSFTLCYWPLHPYHEGARPFHDTQLIENISHPVDPGDVVDRLSYDRDEAEKYYIPTRADLDLVELLYGTLVPPWDLIQAELVKQGQRGADLPHLSVQAIIATLRQVVSNNSGGVDELGTVDDGTAVQPFDGVHIDAANRKISRNGKLAEFESKTVPWKLFTTLYERRGSICPYKELIDATWTSDDIVTEVNLQSHVTAIRKLIQPLQLSINNVRQHGYRLRDDAVSDA